LSVADITILLALSVYQLIVSDILPVSSSNVPVIGQSAIPHFYIPNIYQLFYFVDKPILNSLKQRHKRQWLWRHMRVSFHIDDRSCIIL